MDGHHRHRSPVDPEQCYQINLISSYYQKSTFLAKKTPLAEISRTSHTVKNQENSQHELFPADFVTWLSVSQMLPECPQLPAQL